MGFKGAKNMPMSKRVSNALRDGSFSIPDRLVKPLDFKDSEIANLLQETKQSLFDLVSEDDEEIRCEDRCTQEEKAIEEGRACPDVPITSQNEASLTGATSALARATQPLSNDAGGGKLIWPTGCCPNRSWAGLQSHTSLPVLFTERLLPPRGTSQDGRRFS